MAIGERIGKVFLRVDPDMTRFGAEVAAQAAATPPVKVNIVPTITGKALSAAIKETKQKVAVGISLEKGAVQSAIRERNKDASKTKLKVAVDFDRGQIKRELKEAGAGLFLTVKAANAKQAKEIIAAQKDLLQTQRLLNEESEDRNILLQQEKTLTKETEAAGRVLLEQERARTQETRTRTKETEAAGRILLEQERRATAEFRQRIRGRGGVFASTAAEIDKITRKFFGFERAVGRLLRYTTFAVGGIVAAITAGFAIATGKAIASLAALEVEARNAAAIFAELEPSIRKIGDAARYTDAVTRVTARTIEVARKTSIKTTFTARELSEGLFFLASAGVRANDALGQIGTIAQFAQAGMFDVSKASELLLQSFNAAGLGVRDTGENIRRFNRLADLLTAANIRSQTTIEQLSIALTNRSAAAFRLAGQDIETTVGLLQEFGNVGVTGRRAGEQLAITIREVIRAASGAKDTSLSQPSKEFKRLGIEVFNAEGRARNFAAVVDELAAKIGTLNAREQALALKNLGVTEKSNAGLRQLFVRSRQLRQEGSSLAQRVRELDQQATGATRKIAEQQLATLSARFALFRNQAVALAQIFAGPVSRVIGEFLNRVSGGGRLFDNLQDRAIQLGRALADRVEPALKRLSGPSGAKFFEGMIDGIKGVLRGVRRMFSEFVKGFNRGRSTSGDFLETFGDVMRLFGEFVSKVGPDVGRMIGDVAGFLEHHRSATEAIIKATLAWYVAIKILRTVINPMISLLSHLAAAIQIVSARWAVMMGTVTASTAAGTGLTGTILALVRSIVSPIGLIAALGAATVALIAYNKQQLAAARSASALSINTDDAGEAVGETGTALDKAAGSMSLYGEAAKSAAALTKKVAEELSKPFPKASALESIKQIRRIEREQIRAIRNISKERDKAEQARIIAGLNIDTARAQVEEIAGGRKIDRADLKALQDAISIAEERLPERPAQRSFSERDRAARARRSEILDARALLREQTGIDDTSRSIAAAKQRARDIQVSILESISEEARLRQAISALEDRQARMRGTTLDREIRRADKLRESIGDIVRAAGAISPAAAASVGREARRSTGRAQLRALQALIEVPPPQRQTVPDIRRIQALGRSISALRAGTVGVPNTLKEARLFARELRAIGEIPFGRAFLLSLNRDIFKMIDDVESGKLKVNKLLAEIGETRAGDLFIRSLFNDFDLLARDVSGSTSAISGSIRDSASESSKHFNTIAESARTAIRRGILPFAGAVSDASGSFDDLAVEADSGARLISGSFDDLAVEADSGARLISTTIGGSAKVGSREFNENLVSGMRQSIESAIDTSRNAGLIGNTIIETARAGIRRGILPFAGELSGAVSKASQDAEADARDSGGAIIRGLIWGIQQYLKPGSALYSVLRGEGNSIVSFIRKFKGPLAYDQTILVPAGHAIMGGLVSGLRDGMAPLKSFLQSVGPAIEEFAPIGSFSSRMADFIIAGLGNGGIKLGSPFKFFADLISPDTGDFDGPLDPTLGFLHRTLSLADTTKMAQHLAELVGLRVTSLFRPGAITSSGNVSDHAVGAAADISGDTQGMDRLARMVKPLFGEVFKQIIWRNRDVNRGFPVPGHMDHVHLAWLMGKGFSLGSGRMGSPIGASGPFGDIFAQASKRFGVSAALLRAVTQAESSFNPRAQSPAGAAGLMQLLPSTFKSLGVGGNIFDPRQNVFAGAKYLRAQLDRFGDTRLALAAYNAGPGAVAGHRGIPPYDETIRYVARVMALLRKFGGFREMGGQVQTGRSYFVNEAGPELFVPNRPGFVLSNDRVDRLLGALERNGRGGAVPAAPINVEVNTVSPDPAVVAGLTVTHLRGLMGGVSL